MLLTWDDAAYIVAAVNTLAIAIVLSYSAAPAAELVEMFSKLLRGRETGVLRGALLLDATAVELGETLEIRMLRSAARLFCLRHSRDLDEAHVRNHKRSFFLMFLLFPVGRIVFSGTNEFNYAAGDFGESGDPMEQLVEAVGCVIPLVLFLASWYHSEEMADRGVLPHGSGIGAAPSSPLSVRNPVAALRGSIAGHSSNFDLEALDVENLLKDGRDRKDFMRSVYKWTAIDIALNLLVLALALASWGWQLYRAVQASYTATQIAIVFWFGALNVVSCSFSVGLMLVLLLHIRLMRKLMMLQLRASMRGMLESAAFAQMRETPFFVRYSGHIVEDVHAPLERFVGTAIWLFGGSLIIAACSVIGTTLTPLRGLGSGRLMYTFLLAVVVVLLMLARMWAALSEAMLNAKRPFLDPQVKQAVSNLSKGLSHVRTLRTAAGRGSFIGAIQGAVGAVGAAGSAGHTDGGSKPSPASSAVVARSGRGGVGMLEQVEKLVGTAENMGFSSAHAARKQLYLAKACHTALAAHAQKVATEGGDLSDPRALLTVASKALGGDAARVKEFRASIETFQQGTSSPEELLAALRTQFSASGGGGAVGAGEETVLRRMLPRIVALLPGDRAAALESVARSTLAPTPTAQEVLRAAKQALGGDANRVREFKSSVDAFQQGSSTPAEFIDTMGALFSERGGTGGCVDDHGAALAELLQKLALLLPEDRSAALLRNLRSRVEGGGGVDGSGMLHAAVPLMEEAAHRLAALQTLIPPGCAYLQPHSPTKHQHQQGLSEL